MQKSQATSPAKLAAALFLAAACAGSGFLALAQDPQPEAPAEQPAPERAEEAPVIEAEDGGVLLEDYEASEQISEDLSVSFPVDI